MKYPTRADLINYTIRVRDARVLEFIKVKQLLKKYPQIWPRINFYYKRLELYTKYDINIRSLNKMLNTKKSIEYINQKLDTIYSEDFKMIVNIVKLYK